MSSLVVKNSSQETTNAPIAARRTVNLGSSVLPLQPAIIFDRVLLVPRATQVIIILDAHLRVNRDIKVISRDAADKLGVADLSPPQRIGPRPATSRG